MESKLSFNAMSAKTKSSELDRRRNRKGKTRGEIVGPRTEGKQTMRTCDTWLSTRVSLPYDEEAVIPHALSDELFDAQVYTCQDCGGKDKKSITKAHSSVKRATRRTCKGACSVLANRKQRSFCIPNATLIALLLLLLLPSCLTSLDTGYWL